MKKYYILNQYFIVDIDIFYLKTFTFSKINGT